MVGYLEIAIIFCLLRHPFTNFSNPDLILRRDARISGQVERELDQLHYANEVAETVGLGNGFTAYSAQIRSFSGVSPTFLRLCSGGSLAFIRRYLAFLRRGCSLRGSGLPRIARSLAVLRRFNGSPKVYLP